MKQNYFLRALKNTLLLTSLFCLTSCQAVEDQALSPLPDTTTEASIVYTEDIKRFWQAYDAIEQETDESQQLILLNDLYIDKGTPGLHAMMRARSYRSQEYLQAINDYPEFWAAVRANTEKVDSFAGPVSEALKEIKSIYPDGKDVPIYFVIGALRTGGTALDNKLLIGAELAMSDSNTPSHELSERLSHLSRYFENNPIENFVDLNLHEYIHTQQKTTSGYNLLSQSLFEGVAEYVSTKALGRDSKQESIIYGHANTESVRKAFEADILKEDFSDWIWNSSDNAFGVRDLGYFIGYAIAEQYVEQSDDRLAAIKALIELDYMNPEAVEAIVDASGFFPKPIASYR